MTPPPSRYWGDKHGATMAAAHADAAAERRFNCMVYAISAACLLATWWMWPR